MNFNDFKKLTETGVGLAVASRNRQLIPDLDDLAGLRLNPDGKTLVCFINSVDSPTALANLRSCPNIAISMSRPTDYFAAQIKGQVTKIRKMTSEEELASQNWSDLYRQELVLISVPPETVSSLTMRADTALEVTIEDLFVQTPGIHAGTRIIPS